MYIYIYIYIRLKQSVLLVGSRIKSAREFQTIDPATVESLRQVDDDWRNADAAACQHWRPGCSAPTDTVVRAVQTLVNCHCKVEENPVGNVEPLQLVVQYLTKAAIKLPSAGDNTSSSVQHPL